MASEPAKTAPWHHQLPGVLAALLAAVAAGVLADRYAAPLTLLALLIGLALNAISSGPRLASGLLFASRDLLRWAIVLVGARVTLDQMLALGPLSLLAVVMIVALAIGTGVLAARLLGLGAAFGTLSGGAVGICGASAAMALFATLGERIRQAELTLVLVGTSVMSSLALILYPAICQWLGLDDVQAGFVLGAAIHDVAQTLGAGYAVSETAGETATIVKMARVALLAPVLALVAVAFHRSRDGISRAAPLLPWFVIGFFLVAGLNSTGIIPSQISDLASRMSGWLLAVSIAATAMRSPLAELVSSGPKPLLVGVLASLASLAAALTFALLAL